MASVEILSVDWDGETVSVDIEVNKSAAFESVHGEVNLDVDVSMKEDFFVTGFQETQRLTIDIPASSLQDGQRVLVTALIIEPTVTQDQQEYILDSGGGGNGGGGTVGGLDWRLVGITAGLGAVAALTFNKGKK